ncbi:MAG: hypothetical protein HYU43_08375, partial [Armatimonadetes bacterium]|nr:hypothetical protein [Armatimonadota bacterium]
EVALPVSCVEHGRWHDVSPRFSAGEASYFSLRREKMEHVHSNLRAGGGHVADQGAIWNHIAEKEEVAGSASPTRAMHDLYRHRVDDIGEYARAFPYMDGAVGMIVAMNGRIAGGDLFDQARTAGSLWGKLIRSYAMDALDGGRGVSVSRERAKRLLERTRGARCEAYPSLALGVDVRLMGDGMVGAALVYRDTPVHVSLFRTHGGQGRSKSGMVRSSLRRGFRMSGPQGGPTRRD